MGGGGGERSGNHLCIARYIHLFSLKSTMMKFGVLLEFSGQRLSRSGPLKQREDICLIEYLYAIDFI